jgi:hypothetical protein
MDVMSKFLQAEINSQELYEDIYAFIISYGIRNGEFEGNEYIVKKMDRDNFIIFPEYEDEDGGREIPFSVSVYKKQLIDSINNYAKEKGIIIVNS